MLACVRGNKCWKPHLILFKVFFFSLAASIFSNFDFGILNGQTLLAARNCILAYGASAINSMRLSLGEYWISARNALPYQVFLTSQIIRDFRPAWSGNLRQASSSWICNAVMQINGEFFPYGTPQYYYMALPSISNWRARGCRKACAVIQAKKECLGLLWPAAYPSLPCGCAPWHLGCSLRLRRRQWNLWCARIGLGNRPANGSLSLSFSISFPLSLTLQKMRS